MKTSKFHALRGLDRDIRQALWNQLRDLWTHTSTALEGNTLTLGETKFVIEEGLTVSGKPLKDHQEIMGHARAIGLIHAGLGEKITASHLFDLHQAVQSEFIADSYKPYGAWKVEPNGTYAVTEDGRQVYMNGTYAVTEDGRQVYIEYAAPESVPGLMAQWLAESNRLVDMELSETEAIDAYAKLHLGFVHVHPFRDGNDRLARLLSNIPLLSSGHLPLMIAIRDRKAYVDTLAKYERESGQPTIETGVWPPHASDAAFRAFCRHSYRATRDLIAQAKTQQANRNMVRSKG